MGHLRLTALVPDVVVVVALAVAAAWEIVVALAVAAAWVIVVALAVAAALVVVDVAAWVVVVGETIAQEMLLSFPHSASY